MKPLALAAALAVLSAPGAAGAHGVEAEVERSGAGIAVRARHHRGRPLAGARYEIVSPADPERAHASGLTDRHGWVAFEPDAAGTWRIRIADADGHGSLVEVEVAPGELAAAPPAAAPRPSTPPAPSAAPAPPARGRGPEGERGADERGPGRTPLRVAAGAVALLAFFGAVFAVQRRRRRGAR